MNEQEFFADVRQAIADSFSAETLNAIADRIRARRSIAPFANASAVLVLSYACRSIAAIWEGPVSDGDYGAIRARFETLFVLLLEALGNGDRALISSRADDLAAELLA
ncbi:MAG: hypothetical protein NUW01_02140 [Gemmatimonadaceae bacterium]|nr:hypothetical protein [Gemmatimonadaceae bacterium]